MKRILISNPEWISEIEKHFNQSVNEIDPWIDLAAHCIDGEMDCYKMEPVELYFDRAFPIENPFDKNDPIPDIDRLFYEIADTVTEFISDRHVVSGEFDEFKAVFRCFPAFKVVKEYGTKHKSPPLLTIEIRPEWVDIRNI